MWIGLVIESNTGTRGCHLKHIGQRFTRLPPAPFFQVLPVLAEYRAETDRAHFEEHARLFHVSRFHQPNVNATAHANRDQRARLTNVGWDAKTSRHVVVRTEGDDTQRHLRAEKAA